MLPHLIVTALLGVALLPGAAHAHPVTLAVPAPAPDPLAMALLLLAAGLYARGIRRAWDRAGTGRGVSRLRAAAFALGWLTLAIGFLSPLHEAAEHSFAAHMLQHALLVVVASPLLAIGGGWTALGWSAPGLARRSARLLRAAPVRPAASWIASPTGAALCHGGALWVWHWPPLYALAVTSAPVHAAQHLVLLGTGVVFWWALLEGRRHRGAALAWLLITTVHTAILGAALALAPEPLYAPYRAALPGQGMTPLEDQQLAGIIMWVPMGIAYLIGAVALVAGGLRESERRSERRMPRPPGRLGAPPLASDGQGLAG
jgi:putative membrane protein